MSAVATLPTGKAPSLLEKFSSKFAIDQDKLLTTLKATAFKVKDKEVSNEQMTALLIVADQYGLNPFTKEIFAFPDKHNGIVPVVSVDGWARIINEHGALDGIEFRYADKSVTMNGAKSCPEWCEVVIKRKDRAQPIVVREYLDEVFRDLDYTNPWRTHTKRFLRHKTLIQGSRVAFGFGGIYDEDEAVRILEAHAVEGTVTAKTVERIDGPTAKSAVQSDTGERTGPGPTLETCKALIAKGDVDAARDLRQHLSPADQQELDKLLGQPTGDGKLLQEGQKRILRATLSRAGLTDIDVHSRFGKKLDEMPIADFNKVSEWAQSKPSTTA